MGSEILVYDVGTSSLKAAVYDGSGKVTKKKSQHYQFTTPQEGWAEIDPHIWWESLIAVTAELSRDGLDLQSVQGIAVTGQMHSAVLLGENDEVLSPSILWLDRRAGKETKELQDRFSLPPYKLNSTSSLPKLYWQSKYQKGLLERVKTILWPKDYIRYQLTGCKVTDYTEGLGSALIDWNTKKWCGERIEVCGLSHQVLPKIAGQEEMLPIRKDIAEELGFSPDCRVLIGMGDIAALLGGAPHTSGRLVYSMGSSSMYFTEVPSIPEKQLGLYTLDIGGYKLYGGVSSTTGAALKWIYEKLWEGEPQISFESMVEKALNSKMERDPVIFFPFLAGERSPFWSDSLSGSFEGLKLHHTKEHLTRAVMEGVALSIRYILDLMEQAGVDIEEIAFSGGGANTAGWPEMIASATGKTVLIYNTEETVTTVLYAIMKSSFENRSFRDILKNLFSKPREIQPSIELTEAYKTVYMKYKRLLQAKIGIYDLSLP